MKNIYTIIVLLFFILVSQHLKGQQRYGYVVQKYYCNGTNSKTMVYSQVVNVMSMPCGQKAEKKPTEYERCLLVWFNKQMYDLESGGNYKPTMGAFPHVTKHLMEYSLYKDKAYFSNKQECIDEMMQKIKVDVKLGWRVLIYGGDCCSTSFDSRSKNFTYPFADIIN